MIPQPIHKAYGLSLGSTCWAVAPISPSLKSWSSDPNRHIAPSVLLPIHHGEPIRFDTWYPPHPRGAGQTLPVESRVSEVDGTGRFPLAAAWTGRVGNRSHTWKWNGGIKDAQYDSMTAIKSGIASLAKVTSKSNPVGIVVPNDFRQEEQQQVIDECQLQGLDAALIWQPIAAALNWLRNHSDLLPSPSNMDSDDISLAIIHTDWGYGTFTKVNLTPWPKISPNRWLPVRTRPSRDDRFESFGWTTLSPRTSRDSFSDQWMATFVKPVSEILDRELYIGKQVNLLPERWQIPMKSPAAYQDRLERFLKAFRKQPIAVISLGDWESVLQFQHLVSSRLIGEQFIRHSGTAAETFLAEGAAIFREAQLNNETCYLDTLPELDLFIEKDGEYQWHPLLTGDATHVEGGKVWNCDQPIDVSVRRGEDSVSLVVAHEEYEGVRELIAPLDRPAEKRVPGKLFVSATPAQGNAVLRIDIDPINKADTQSIVASWRRMTVKCDSDGKPFSKERYLEESPRAFPELLPRLSSSARWNSVVVKIKNLLSLDLEKSIHQRSLWSIKEAVLLKDQSFSPKDATAIGSDHVPPSDPELLSALVDRLLHFIRNTKDLTSKNVENAVRILSYISTSDISFQEWLIDPFNDKLRIDRSAIINGCGHCLRNPVLIRNFIVRMTAIESGSRSTPSSNKLKAVSQILRYRFNATQSLTDDEAYKIIEICLKIFEHEMRNTSGRTFAFRWASLIIVYLLRRRMYSSEFLPPDGELAVRAKQLFEEAIERYNQRKLRPIGGSVDTPAAIRQMINYIDKKGVGPLLLGSE